MSFSVWLIVIWMMRRGLHLPRAHAFLLMLLALHTPQDGEPYHLTPKTTKEWRNEGLPKYGRTEGHGTSCINVYYTMCVCVCTCVLYHWCLILLF